MDILRYYTKMFNEKDEEVYKNEIDNAHALEWLEEEIPLLECPDKEIERTYYFRWWTYRKHLKKTPEGYVITEFLPKVPWSGRYNTINAAVGHHLAEGRWLKNSKTYLTDYINFFLNNSSGAHHYSAWFIYAAMEFVNISGAEICDKAFVKSICKYYERWETEHGLPNGMFWSYDNYDAMEYSISGTVNGKMLKGIRPTLNSYMCADAFAVSEFARKMGMKETAAEYYEKYISLKELILNNLWDGGFFKAFHYNDNETLTEVFKKDTSSIPRELIGYIPWMFNIVPKGYERVFDLLCDKTAFLAEYGITTAEQNDERFMYSADHECLWNGYVWPFATSQTLTALINVMVENPHKQKYKDMFLFLLKQYAASHTIITETGETLPWIDEVKHPYRNEWTSRSVLKNWNWKEEKGGYERGKDYNHSTFCDLVISGIAGVHCRNGSVEVNPVIPKEWDYFKICNLNVQNNIFTIIYDKTGEKYGGKEGITILKNGKILVNKGVCGVQ